MIALDTNVVVRFLVRDDEKQALCVYKRFKLAEKNRKQLFIPQTVLLETLWVLESAYKLSREEILDSLEALNQMPIIEFESDYVLDQMIVTARNTRQDLSDILIGYASENAGCNSVLTFDKKASKLPMFELLR
ncbi:MAG: type II toxin-antitoxin system VapC family toxin [Kiritimatiellae bacterium]|jgi:predicted nucleic-acid-binding protein|nr:type II toxin-antitoxin system VapC family toxin [Kiritimatiellia bacterium]